MSHSKPFPDPANARSLIDEADIGSGEKTPGQLETEQMIREIPPLAQDENENDAAGGDAAGAGRERREHDASLLRDEPADDVNALDPAPPKGD